MDKKMTFESALKRLEEIVTELEAGEIALDDSIKVFEEGNKLVTFCMEKLGSAERRIKKLVRTTEEGFKLEDL